MRVNLQLPDELYDTYASRANERNRRVDRLLADELKKIYPLDLARDRVIVIDPANRQRIESLLGEGHLTGATDLADKLERLLGISVGGIALDFTPSQRHELSELAARNGFTPEELVRSTVKSMEELFFNHAYDVASQNSEELKELPSPSPPEPAADLVDASALGDVDVPTPASVLAGAPTESSAATDPPDPSPNSAPNVLKRFLGGLGGKKD